MAESALLATEVVPVFPLPNVVFFPGTVLPLHIFEPRYRKMVADVQDGNRQFAIALIRADGKQAGDENPAIHSIGTLGRVVDLDPLPDGRFNLQLAGLHRVEFEELPSDKPYRLARCRPRPEASIAEGTPEVREAKLELMASHSYLLSELTEEASTAIPIDEALSLEAAVNRACANLPVEPWVRQELLEDDDLLSRRQRVVSLIHEILERVLQLKSPTPLN